MLSCLFKPVGILFVSSVLNNSFSFTLAIIKSSFSFFLPSQAHNDRKASVYKIDDSSFIPATLVIQWISNTFIASYT